MTDVAVATDPTTARVLVSSAVPDQPNDDQKATALGGAFSGPPGRTSRHVSTQAGRPRRRRPQRSVKTPPSSASKSPSCAPRRTGATRRSFSTTTRHPARKPKPTSNPGSASPTHRKKDEPQWGT